jgi:hypothetical protein
MFDMAVASADVRSSSSGGRFCHGESAVPSSAEFAAPFPTPQEDTTCPWAEEDPPQEAFFGSARDERPRTTTPNARALQLQHMQVSSQWREGKRKKKGRERRANDRPALASRVVDAEKLASLPKARQWSGPGVSGLLCPAAVVPRRRLVMAGRQATGPKFRRAVSSSPLQISDL